MKYLSGRYLTQAQVELLQVAANELDHSAKHLAKVTHYEESTIDSMFTDIDEQMGVHSRGCAIIEAVRHGIVTLDMPAKIEQRERERPSEQRRIKRGYDLQKARESTVHLRTLGGRCFL